MEQADLKLVDNTNTSELPKDFNTIDLDKIQFGVDDNQVTSMQVSSSDPNANANVNTNINTNNQLDDKVLNLTPKNDENDMQKLNTLKEPIAETLVS